jgi:hypothetical protein
MSRSYCVPHERVACPECEGSVGVHHECAVLATELHAECANLRAQLERVTKDLAAAQAEAERCVILEDSLDVVVAERDRMRPVFEAAMAYAEASGANCEIGDHAAIERFMNASNALRNACALARKAETGGGE